MGFAYDGLLTQHASLLVSHSSFKSPTHTVCCLLFTFTRLGRLFSLGASKMLDSILFTFVFLFITLANAAFPYRCLNPLFSSFLSCKVWVPQVPPTICELLVAPCYLPLSRSLLFPSLSTVNCSHCLYFVIPQSTSDIHNLPQYLSRLIKSLLWCLQ